MTSIVCAGHFSFCFSGIAKSILGEHLFPTFNSSKWFPDVIFHFKDGRQLYGHACILASRSIVLQNQLIEEKKKSPDGNEVHLEISEHSYEQFQSLLTYIYSDRIDFSELSSLYPLISHYSIPRLMEYIRLVQKETTSVSPSTLQIDFMNTLLPEDSTITKLFGNVLFQVDDHIIPTHKVFLCARSEYFNAMFERGMVESKTNLVKIANDRANPQFCITSENVRCMLQFLYTDKLDIDVNQAIGLLPLATQYQLERCKHLCESLIEKEVEIESVCYVYQVARFYGAERLKVFCIRFIKENYEALKQTEVWNNLTTQEQEEISSFK